MFKGERVIVPKSMQKEMLAVIHSSHLGVEKCKRRARDVLYWPGMNSEIEDVVSRCQVCSTYQRSNPKEPLLSHQVPQRPWARVGADLFKLNSHSFLILVDYCSSFIEVEQLRDTKSEVIMKLCKSQFARYGIPDTLVTDNGPQFSSEAFRNFACCYGFQHCTSSPHYPQSNGRAEKAVQTIKSLIKKANADKKDIYLALLELQNAPINDQLGSPVQRLMGRRTKPLLPTSSQLLIPKTITPEIVLRQLKQQQKRQKQYYDQHTKPLPNLNKGDRVNIQSDDGKWRPAKIMKVSNASRSYIVTTPDGSTYPRNRRHRDYCKDDSYLSDDDEPISTGAEICVNSTDHQVESNNPDQSPTHSDQSIHTPVRRSKRDVKQPLRYNDTWSLHS